MHKQSDLLKATAKLIQLALLLTILLSLIGVRVARAAQSPIGARQSLSDQTHSQVEPASDEDPDEDEDPTAVSLSQLEVGQTPILLVGLALAFVFLLLLSRVALRRSPAGISLPPKQ